MLPSWHVAQQLRNQPRVSPEKHNMTDRISTGIPKLDVALGGGLLPGSLTMLIGATGVGKTQFGMHFFGAGKSVERSRGAIIDLSSRGDSQNHLGYFQRMNGEALSEASLETELPVFAQARPADVLPFLGYRGRRVLRSQMDVDEWHNWQSELNRRAPQLYRFVYGHLVHGTRRFVVDGIEPQENSADSLQLDLLELIYHQMLKKEHDWLAREVLRESFRENAGRVQELAYDHRKAACMVLVTTKHLMLDQLITQPLADGDLAAGANTVILIGRTQGEKGMGRAAYIAKHRGSYADEGWLPFSIDDTGICLHD